MLSGTYQVSTIIQLPLLHSNKNGIILAQIHKIIRSREGKEIRSRFMIKVTPSISGKRIFIIWYWENWHIIWINDINVKGKLIKVNKWRWFFFTLVLEKVVLNKTRKTLTMFINKTLNCIKAEALWSMKRTKDIFTRWVTGWNKTFVAYETDKGLIFQV